MTTRPAGYADLQAAIREARDLAVEVLAAVRRRRDQECGVLGALVGVCKAADTQLQNAALNVATIELLPEILDDALEERPDEAAASFEQALVIVNETRASTERYAAWAAAGDLRSAIARTWDALVELLADVAHEVAGAILVVGKRALKGLGWLPWVLGGVVVVGLVAKARG